MRKTFVILLCALMALLLSAGCSARRAPGRADNDILTYERVDPDRTTLVLSRTGNTGITGLTRAFEEKNPDVQVLCIDITGGDGTTIPAADWVREGFAPDIMFVPRGFIPNDMCAEYFENMSAYPFVENFELEALNWVAVDSHIYWLPGPAQIDCMMYNKTLFARYGWTVPQTFDEFIDLCLRIREDTNGEIQPWNPNAKYSNEFLKVMEGFFYQELFAGLDNRTWYREFCAGNGVFTGHMEPYYAGIQRLIDNGLLLEEHFSYSATTRGKEFASGQIAMYNYPAAIIASDEYEFGFMPFPATEGQNGYVYGGINCLLGVPKKAHTEKERDAIDRFLRFYSSAEGQQAFIGDLLMASSVKDVPLNQPAYLASLQSAIEQGHMFELLDFQNPAGGRANFSLYGHALAMVKGEKTAAECIAAVDAQPYIPPDNTPAAPPEVVATAAENFSILETSLYIADMYRAAAGADIGLINHGVAYRGNLMRIFAGELTSSGVTVLKPRSFAGDSALTKVTMTGAQLLDALNHPVGNDGVSNSIYAFSGLRCRVAPWNAPGEKYLSVSLADGKPLDMDALYTVAIWGGTVAEEYITAVVETYEGSWEEHMSARLRADGTIKPAGDGRITLVWN